MGVRFHLVGQNYLFHTFKYSINSRSTSESDISSSVNLLILYLYIDQFSLKRKKIQLFINLLLMVVDGVGMELSPLRSFYKVVLLLCPKALIRASLSFTKTLCISKHPYNVQKLSNLGKFVGKLLADTGDNQLLLYQGLGSQCFVQLINKALGFR